MLPVTHGEAETRRRILLYALVLIPVTLAVAALGVAGPIYWVPAALLDGLFVFYAFRLLRSRAVPHAIRLFRFSILYLFLLFVSLTADSLARSLWRAPLG
jgi:protoheme IX farnesyltransferase